MANDDLGQFPQPPTTPQTDSNNAPAVAAPSITPEPKPIPEFEETPDEIPTPATNQESAPEPPTEISEPVSEPVESLTPPPQPISPLPPQLPPLPPIQPTPAVLPPKSGSSFAPVIFAVLFFTAIGGLAGAAFLYQQSAQLKKQLLEITNTLDKQKTNPEVTPTPSIIEVPTTSITPSEITPTPSASISATPTPTSTPTPTPTTVYVPGTPMKPLSISPKILKIAIDHQPNAQFILLKTENASDPDKAATKYFFRQDLTTKKYFYVLVSGRSEPELVDKQIYVTPDDNIPSLNDLVLENKLGIDLDEAIGIVKSNCNCNDCEESQMKAQYIKTAKGAIWQITITVQGKTQQQVMQLNAQTKATIFKTADFVEPGTCEK